MLKYAIGQLKTNKIIKAMTVLMLAVLVIIFSMSLYLSNAVFNFIVPRYYNPNAKVDVTLSAAGGENFIFPEKLKAYEQYITKVTPSMELFGLYNSNSSSNFIAISGVNHKDIFFDEDYEIVEGTFVLQPKECLLPISFAQKLGFNIGDSVEIECNEKTVSLKVVGIFKGFKVNTVVEKIIVSEKTTAYFLLNNYVEGLSNTLNVQLNGSISAQDFVDLLKTDAQKDTFNATVAKDLSGRSSALSLANIPTAACIIMLLFLVIIVVFALYYLDNIKQHKFITVFRDIGASKRQICSVFLGTHTFMGVIGGLIGAVFAGLIALGVSSVVGIKVNPFAVAACGFFLLIISNSIISFASTSYSISHRKNKTAKPKAKSSSNIICIFVLLFCVIVFVLSNLFTRQILNLNVAKYFIAISSFVFLIVAIWLAINLMFKIYQWLHVKAFKKSKNIGLWLASSNFLNSKQIKNFFMILTVAIVTITTTSSLLYSVQHVAKSTINHIDNTVIYCNNIQSETKQKFIDTFSEYNTKIYWTATENIQFKSKDNISSKVNVLDNDLIDNLSIYKNLITAEQREYFDSDSIGVYYSLARNDMLKEKVGTIKLIETGSGVREVPYLGYLNESAHYMSDIFINRATAEYLGVELTQAYVQLLEGELPKVLASVKSKLFEMGIVSVSQESVCEGKINLNKPMSDMFKIANFILIFLLFLTLIFYLVLIANYQIDSFAKFKALGMTKKTIMSSQAELIVPVCMLAAIFGGVIAQLLKVCYNIIFNYTAVGAVRDISLFNFIGLPICVATVGALGYLCTHYFAAKNKQSIRNDLER